MDLLIGYINEFWHMMEEMAPYLLLGFLVAGYLHVYVRKSVVGKYLGGTGLRPVVNSALIGIPLPLCSCGVIPTGVSFYKNGASRGASVSFLISTPQTGVDSILVTYSMLGLPLAIIRPIIAFVTGIFGGLLTDRATNGQVNSEATQEEPITENAPRQKGILPMLRYGFVDFLDDIARPMLVGLLIAAGISLLVPDNYFADYSGGVLDMLMMLLVSVPMYVCATGSVPIAAALLMKGISPGAALVFLMAGPATNAATIAVLSKVFGRKTTKWYLISIIGGALLFGFLVNLLPASWFGTGAIMSGHSGHSPLLWLKTGAAVILSLLLANILFGKYIRRLFGISKKEVTMANTKIKVDGMNCNHCKMNVENNLNALPGIAKAVVDIDTSTVAIEGENYDMSQIEATVNKIGYKYGGEV